MKTLASLLAILAITISSAVAGESKFFSYVIHESDAPYSIELPANLVMKISNFVQAGGDTAATVAVHRGAAPGINVLVASPMGSTPHESHEDTYIAGANTVTVAPVPGATLFISFQLAKN